MVREKRCARCGKRIGIIIERASGQPIVVDAEPVWMIRDDAGPAWALSVDGALLHGHRRPRGTPGAVICYMPHYATCPNRKVVSQSDVRRMRRAAAPTKAPARRTVSPRREPEKERTDEAEQVRLW